MKKKLIISITNLVMTFFLFICVIYGWYVSNKVVSANGIFGSSAGESYSLKLQRGTYSKTDEEWTWFDADSLSFSNVSPGNKFFFRIVITTEPGSIYNFDASFSDITSTLVPNKLTVTEDGYIATIESDDLLLNLYKIESDDVVTVLHGDEVKTLYKIDGDTISLVDFKIQNTFNFYQIGSVEPSDASLTEYTAHTLSTSNFDFTVNAINNESYFYFALEFNEEKSLELIDGIESSNCYLYQKLSIGHIQITSSN